MNPKEIYLFYARITKSCYVVTGRKRLAFIGSIITCGVPVARGDDKIA